MNGNIFETLRNLISASDLKDLMESRGVRFGGKYEFFCPFHDNDKTPAASIKGSKDGAFYHCFGCGESGDAVKFIEKTEGLKTLEAAKVVADYFKVPFEYDGEASEEQKSAWLAKKERREKEAAARREREAAKEQDNREKLKSRLSSVAPSLVEGKTYAGDKWREMLDALFPFHGSEEFLRMGSFLGYSAEHGSIAVIIRDEAGEPVNIKYREKWKWDSESRTWDYTTRHAGKWIGESGAGAYPFPYQHFAARAENAERVFVTEGEKDALNLISLGECALTLGGAGSKWENWAKLLKGKDVYIWFDNDLAGYENAIKRAREIAQTAKSVYMVDFLSLAQMLKRTLPPKYDVSDFIKDEKELIKELGLNSLIIHHCARVNNAFIETLAERVGANDEKAGERLLALKGAEKGVKNFADCIKEICAKDKDGNYLHAVAVKPGRDCEEIERIRKSLEGGSNSAMFKAFKSWYFTNTEFASESEASKFEKSFGEFFTARTAIWNEFKKQDIYDIVEAAKATLKKSGVMLGKSAGALYYWAGNHFAPLNDKEVKFEDFLQLRLYPMIGVDMKKRISNITDQVARDLYKWAYDIDVAKAEQERRVVNVLNGTLFISKYGKLTFKSEHNYRDGATNILKFEYDPSADCPKFRAFLRQAVSDEADRAALMEFFGYCLLPHHNFERFLFLYGKGGANGKSVILNVLESLFGADYVSHKNLQDLQGHELDALNNKFLNIGTEIDGKNLNNGQLAVLKALVSPKDSITVNPKNRDGYTIAPSAKPKFAFSGNAKPRQGLDDGVFRRMLLISFDRSVDDRLRVGDLADKFDDERAGIFNLALEGMRRLIAQNGFTQSKRMRNELEEYKDEVNPMRVFIRDCLKPSKDGGLPKNQAYQLYTKFITDRGGRSLSKAHFFQALQAELMSDGVLLEVARNSTRSVIVGSDPASMALSRDLGEQTYMVWGVEISDAPNVEFDTLAVKDAVYPFKAFKFKKAR